MNIPPKYEDVVAQLEAAKMINLAGEHVESHLEKQIDILRISLEAAMGREAALREELDAESKGADRAAESLMEWRRDCVALQQRLTVAEQRADRLASLSNDDLIAIARTAALNSVHRYNYMPSLPDEAYAWEPHYWVIEAMRAALKPAEEGEGVMKKNKLDAIKKLESALLAVKRAGLMLVGIDNSILYTVIDADLSAKSRERSAVEAILSRANDDHPGTGSVNHSGAYRDSGGA